MTQKEPLAHKRAMMLRIQTEGTSAAYDALLAVCRDGKATASARATSATTLFRAAGYLDNKDGGSDKSPEDMTSAELSARIKELRARQQVEPEATDDNDAQRGVDDVFG